MIQHSIIFIAVAAGMSLSVVWKKLTLPAAITGGLVCLVIYAGVGTTGIVLLSAFFILGVLATSWKHSEKKKLNTGDEGSVARTAGQVFANSGLAAVLGLLALFFPENKSLFLLMLAAAFSSATSDTLSSELGNVYGKNFYNILSLRRDERGLNGVVSLEGSFFGILGSLIIAIVYALCAGWSYNLFWIVIAGTLGNLSDSILGAALERRNILKNDSVNFLNTLVAALIMWVLFNVVVQKRVKQKPDPTSTYENVVVETTGQMLEKKSTFQVIIK